ncbi:MAG: GDSL-type esterase/lipase family protein [Tenericutes bacterium]|nr:GDSL-type esterase/lipase family protein [Mycoplasmatota bacterium]
MSQKREEIKAIIKADYEKKVEKFRKQNETQKVVFLGDSIVAYFPVEKFNIENKVINHGIPGDTTIGVLNRLTETIRLNPTKVILSIGSNDLVLTDLSIDQTIKNIIEIKNKIEKETNNKVYIVSLTPMLKDHELTNMNYVEGRTNDQHININNQLRKRIDGKEFIDIYNLLLGNKDQLSPDLTTDGIHLNTQGYQIYYDAIKHLID